MLTTPPNTALRIRGIHLHHAIPLPQAAFIPQEHGDAFYSAWRPSPTRDPRWCAIVGRDCPSLFLTHKSHRLGPDSFHGILKRRVQEAVSNPSPSRLWNLTAESYAEWDPSLSAPILASSREFLFEHGFPTSFFDAPLAD